MFRHVMLGCRDLDRAASFYDAVLAPLGLVRRAVVPDGGPASACWTGPGKRPPHFFVTMPFDREPASAGNGAMVAFDAPSRDAVDAAYAAGMAASGTDDGPPGLRLHYAPDYYGAYLRDLDGNKIHFVHRGG